MTDISEPICAIITPPGYAAINVIRISGKGSIGIVAQYFKPRKKLLNSPSHRVVFGTFHTKEGRAIDQVLCTVFRAPYSYTGEDVVEISSHGNPQIASQILENLLLDARMANPGEFTLRAVLNGKMDLPQAEAVNDLVFASGAMAESAALMQVQGILSQHLQKLLNDISDTRLRCELAIDFADQDLPLVNPEDLKNRISNLLKQAEDLYAEGTTQGKYIREGIKICLVGPTNSGKSSLFNALLKYSRAIVNPQPGTTRDYLEERVNLQGYTIILYDTAGLRMSSDEIEKEGIERTRELMDYADLILYLLPVDQEINQREIDELAPDIKNKTLWVASKYDLINPDLYTIKNLDILDGHLPDFAIPASVYVPNGLEKLQQEILNHFALPQKWVDRPLVTNARHLAALSRAISSLQNALQSIENQAGYEFTAFDLIATSQALEEILGIVTTEDLLTNIFNNFCIGK
ncbi:MAG: tRNA uridine-5-carboxymethylaminomethyl(34) synthesis GTPase MnmE [Candidatus Cloacimonetes bacterium]|mgnify:CR=1 FL=1|jgi:tRNA modification GTPase|nr:tRNA uridine-5-carboxymethylaminomethyl(34) synthesis GTPase MnmE [Candidatus Cloacimonadota bacterium]